MSGLFSKTKTQGTSAHQDPTLELHLSNFPQLLFPVAPPARFQPPTTTASSPPEASAEDTVVSGFVIAVATRSTPIECIRIVWEVSYYTRPAKDAPWAPRASWIASQVDITPLTTMDAEAEDEEERWLDAGQTRLDFSLSIPANLPPTTNIPLSRVAHTVYASVIAPPSPSHSRRSSMHVSTPPYSPKASPQEVESMRRLSTSSTRGRPERGASTDRTAVSRFLPDLISPLALDDSHQSSASLYACSEASTSSLDLCSYEQACPMTGLGLANTAPAESSPPAPARSGSFDLFGMGRQKPRAPSVRSNASVTGGDVSQSPPMMSPPSMLHSLLRLGSPGASTPDLQGRRETSPRPALAVLSPKSSSKEASRSASDREKYPSVCLPALAIAFHNVEVHALHSQPGAMPRMEWVCEEQIPGIGPVSINSSSGCFALGGAFNFHMRLSDLKPNITVHFLTVNLVQYYGRAPDTYATSFSLHKSGAIRRPGLNGRPTEGGYLWRGKIGQALEASDQPKPPAPKKGKKQPRVELSKVSRPEPGPGATSTDHSYTVTLPLRLPSPVVGAIPGTPAATSMPPGVQRVMHKLCVEVYFSAIGEDQAGRPYPNGGRGGMGTERQEGGLRKCVINRNVEVGPCSATPCCLLLPPYDPAHALRVVAERPERELQSTPPSLLDPCKIVVVPKSHAPVTYPDHHLRTDRMCSVDELEYTMSCLCFWDAAVLEKYVGKFSQTGQWLCPTDGHKHI